MLLETKFVSLPNARLDVKADEGQPVRVAGYGSTFSGPPDAYGDIIAAGAYAATIREWNSRPYKIPMLFNHDPSNVIGKWSELLEDAVGLRMEGELTPGHSLANDVAASLRHQSVSGLSIGFRTKRASHDEAASVRTLEEIELFEVSVVTNPANERARVTGVKSADQIQTIRDFEVMLRDAGYSRRHAERIATHGFKAFLAARDGQPDEEEPTTRPVRDERGVPSPPASKERREDGKAAVNLLAALRELRITLPS